MLSSIILSFDAAFCVRSLSQNSRWRESMTSKIGKQGVFLFVFFCSFFFFLCICIWLSHFHSSHSLFLRPCSISVLFPLACSLQHCSILSGNNVKRCSVVGCQVSDDRFLLIINTVFVWPIIKLHSSYRVFYGSWNCYRWLSSAD